jgi:hypothetical protein
VYLYDNIASIYRTILWANGMSQCLLDIHSIIHNTNRILEFKREKTYLFYIEALSPNERKITTK